MSRLNPSRVWIGLSILLFACNTITAQNYEVPPYPDHVMITPDDHTWCDAPASLPPGARVMVIEGGPAAEREFAMRLRMPADYSILPHFHSADEHVTVISGSFYMGLGETFDESSAKLLPPGGFAMMRPGASHYAFTREETVVQLHGVRPWGLTYINPSASP